MNKKKLLALLMALVMTLSLMPMTVIAEELETVTPIAEPTEAVAVESVSFEAMNEVAQGSVAQVGGTGYATLAEALEAAQDGDTVTLLTGITLTGYLEVTKTVTLDLNGYTLTRSEDANGVVVNSGSGVLTIADSSSPSTGKIVTSGDGAKDIAVRNIGTGSIIINGGTFKGANWVVDNYGTGSITINSATVRASSKNAVANENAGTVTINDGTFSASQYAVRNSKEGSVVIGGGSISADYNTVYNRAGGEINISGGTVTAVQQGINNYGNGKITISGGSISADYNTVYNRAGGEINISDGEVRANQQQAVFNDSTATVNISGGTIVSSGALAVLNKGNGTVNISGGTIRAVEDAVYNGDYVGQEGTTGVINITGGTLSATDQRAVNNMTGTVNISGGTIKAQYNAVQNAATLNITENVENSSMSPVITATELGAVSNSGVLNISGGSLYSPSQTVCGSGTVTVTGENTVIEAQTGNYAINSTSQVENAILIENGTIRAEHGYGVNGYQITVNGGTIFAGNGVAILTQSDSNEKVKISGGTITSQNNYAVQADTIEISGGTLVGKTTAIFITGTSGSLTVTGEPTIKTGAGSSGYAIYANTLTSFSIAGNGWFDGEIHTSPVDQETYTITGGHFSHDPSTYVDLSQYAVVEYNDVTHTDWFEVNGNPVAKNTTTNRSYATLADAITAANSGDTVKLIANTTEQYVTVPKSITLDLNGKTVTLTESGMCITSNNVDLVITDSSATLDENGYEVEAGTGMLLCTTTYQEALGSKYTLGYDGSTIETYTIELKAGTVKSTNSNNGGIYCNSNATVYVYGGTVGGADTTGKYGIYTLGGNVTVSGKAKVYGATVGIIGQSGNPGITISDDAEVTGGTYGVQSSVGSIAVSDNAKIAGTKHTGIRYTGTGTVRVDGGVVSGGYYGIVTNNASSTVQITGGTISSVYGIYSTAGGNVFVEGGKIDATQRGIVVNAGNVTVSGGDVVGASFGILSNATAAASTVTVSGGKVRSTAGGAAIGAAIVANYGGTYNITGGEVSAPGFGLWITDTSSNVTANISGGKVESTQATAVQNYGGAVTVSGNAQIIGGSNKNGNGISIYGDCTPNHTAPKSATVTISEHASVRGTYGIVVRGKGAELNVEGGTVTGMNAFAIGGNGTINDKSDNSGTVINISGGEIISSANGLFHPQNGELIISGGTITGETGVYVKSGKVTVTGGVFNGVGDKRPYSYNPSGAYPTGDAFVFDSCGYPGGAPTGTISGGEFKSEKARAVGSYIKKDDPNPEYSEEEATDRVTAFITGGLYTGAVKAEAPESSYIAPGYEAAQLNGDNTYGGWEQKYDQWWTIGKVVAKELAAEGTPTDTAAQYKAKKEVVDAKNNVTLEPLGDLITVNVTANASDVATSTDAAKAPAKLTNIRNMQDFVETVTSKTGNAPEVDVLVQLAKGEGKVEDVNTETKKVTYEVHPEAVISVGGNNVATVPLTNDQITGSFTFKLYVPAEVAASGNQVIVNHKHADEDEPDYLGTFTVANDNTITLTGIKSFSDFEIVKVTAGSVTASFDGASLRRRVWTDSKIVVNHETDLRFTFSWTLPEGVELVPANSYFQWKTGNSTEWSTDMVPMGNYVNNTSSSSGISSGRSSLVIEKLGAANFGTDVQVKLHLVYSTDNGVKSLDIVSTARNVNGVANYLMTLQGDDNTKWVKYGKFLLGDPSVPSLIVTD